MKGKIEVSASEAGAFTFLPDDNSVSDLRQEDLVLQFHEQRMSAVATHTRLVDAFDLLVIVYSLVTRITKSANWTGNSSARPGRPATNNSTN
jgi:hypothetical protein